MALTFSNVIGGQARVYTLQHGLKYVIVDVTIGTESDYSTASGDEGIAVSANAASFGLAKVLDVVNASLRATADGDLNQLFWQYDHNTGRVRGFQAYNDEVAAADFAAGDILRLSIIGVG